MLFNEALSNITSTSNTLTLFMASMGWGKTRSVWSLAKNGEKIVFVSPLRSIIEEQKSRELVYFFTEEESKEKSIETFLEKKEGAILLVTPESLGVLKERLLQSDLLFVLDEFHLFYEWGNTFREKLFEFYIDLLSEKKRILALSASVTSELKNTIEDDVTSMGLQCIAVDVGNFEFKNRPTKLYHFRFRILYLIMWAHIYFYFKGRMIIFLSTRREVFSFQKKLREMGIRSSHCVGGEVKDFVDMEMRRENRIIISTSALSHGVNLRNIRRVFVMYRPEKSVEFQMLGRGGRFGESFSAYTLFKKSNKT